MTFAFDTNETYLDLSFPTIRLHLKQIEYTFVTRSNLNQGKLKNAKPYLTICLGMNIVTDLL